MARIPVCEFKEDGCDDPRCKVSLCFLAEEERRLDAIRIKAQEAEVDKESEVLARRRLKKQGIRNPTHQQVLNLVTHPKVRAIAREILHSRNTAPDIKL